MQNVKESKAWNIKCHSTNEYSCTRSNGVLPKWIIEFREYVKSLKHELAQFEDPLCYLCLAGTVVGSWSLIQEVADSNPFNK